VPGGCARLRDCPVSRQFAWPSAPGSRRLLGCHLIELLERYAYYGIYFGFGIYLASLGYSRDQLGIIQSLFLFFSYLIPVVSGRSPIGTDSRRC